MFALKQIGPKKYRLSFIKDNGTELTWEISEKVLRELTDG
jgi:hypothetical protein